MSIDGVLDLAGGSFLSRAGGPTLAAFRSQLIAGRNGGAWNGTSPTGAINSSLAASLHSATASVTDWDRRSPRRRAARFSIAAGDTLLRYTLDGDADLNGSVNLADFIPSRHQLRAIEQELDRRRTPTTTVW
jgi:hypothetical protein